jgi:ABC-type bacteriocin/lantibiotic exporter with double-glycine peptidase domain
MRPVLGPGLLFLLVLGCSHSALRSGAAVRAVPGVPFFPQEAQQCGPAALASMLGFFGHSFSPEAISKEAYDASIGGTSTVAMLSFAARHGLPLHAVRGDLSRLRREVAAGRPLIVLHRVGVLSREYHYVVVTAYDPADGSVYGYSGRDPRARWSARSFERRWAGADRWALVWEGQASAFVPPDDHGGEEH